MRLIRLKGSTNFSCQIRWVLFVLSSVVLFSNGLLAEIEPRPSNDIPPEEIKIDRLNWEEYSEFLLEPIAKGISQGALEISGFPIKEKSNFKPLSPKSSIGIYKITRHSLENTLIDTRSLEVANTLFFLKDDKSGLELSQLSLSILEPGPLRNTMYLTQFGSASGESPNSRTLNIYSPVNQCRDVHFENIQDDIFYGPVSLLDIFASDFPNSDWKSSEVDRKDMFVPDSLAGSLDESVSVDGVKEKLNSYFSESNCSIEIDKQVEVELQNSKRILVNPGVVKMGMRRAKTKIYKRYPVSPFSEIGFEILVSDILNDLPYIKLVYDTKLNFRKAINYYWSSSTQKDLSVRPILDGIVAFDKDFKVAVEMKQQATFEKFNETCPKKKLESFCAIKQ